MDAPWASVPEWPSACFDSALRAWILVDLWVLCRAGGGGFSPLPATSKSPSFMVAPFDTVSMGDISRGASAPSRVSHDYRDVSFSCPRATRRGGRPSIRRVYVGWRVSHRDLRPCVARTPLASGTITCALSVETNSFVRGAFVEAGTFLPSFVGKVSRAHRDRLRAYRWL